MPWILWIWYNYASPVGSTRTKPRRRAGVRVHRRREHALKRREATISCAFSDQLFPVIFVLWFDSLFWIKIHGIHFISFHHFSTLMCFFSIIAVDYLLQVLLLSTCKQQQVVQKPDGYLMGQAAEQGQAAEPLPPGLRDAQISRDWTLDI